MVNLASTEAWREERPEWNDLAALEKALDEDGELPASSVYAYAAFRAGCPFVNFTPNRGASPPALRELAREMRVPHCGADGKTGETLLKTSLGPVFAARALRVLSWQGYNMLGNPRRRGARGSATASRSAGTRTRRCARSSAIPRCTRWVGIDYVPSLHDWKTALDFVHFEGFLGAKMSLQFTWAGCDSALAAPLVIDLVAERTSRPSGARRARAQTACYFKSPLTGGTHDFHEQFRSLMDYDRGVRLRRLTARSRLGGVPWIARAS